MKTLKCEIMVTILVSKIVKEKVKEYSNNDVISWCSIEKTFRWIRETSIEYSNRETTKTNIRINEPTLERLKEFKMYDTESHSDTLLRLLNKAKRWCYEIKDIKLSYLQ